MKPRHFILVALLIGVDQWSKLAVEAGLPFHEVVPVVPFFSLYRTHNTGIAFSMLDGFGPAALVLLSLSIVGFMFYLWKQARPDQRLAHLGFALIIAGALGNVIDRASLGYVVDFFLVHTEDWAFAVFNPADVFITCGAVAIFTQEVWTWWQGRKATPDT